MENALTAEQRRLLRELIEGAGFGGTLRAMADLAWQWADHAEVDIAHCADLRALSARLRVLADEIQRDASFL